MSLNDYELIDMYRYPAKAMERYHTPMINYDFRNGGL
jgi:hypothetical protein